MIKIWAILFFVFGYATVNAQTVEYYAGQNRAGVDIMWFKFFQNKQKSTPFLYFSRNRASVAYNNSPTVFGSTNAISYNFKNGWGIVGFAALNNTGLMPKLGIQYVKRKTDWLYFGWLVADIQKNGNIDFFSLLRYTPKIHEKLHFFSQLEVFPVYNFAATDINYTQRLRLGLKQNNWNGGIMLDATKSRNSPISTNYGIFLRYDW